MQKAQGISVIKDFLLHLPHKPGVYRMYDKDDVTLYVGKAKNLYNRVTNYARGTGHNNRIATMISLTARMEFSLTHTETEALLLEANLIKKLRPRFNVLLRDDKSFPYVLIPSEHEFPGLEKHRGTKKRKGDYFGPFASAGAVNKTLDTLQKAFLIRSCSDSVYANRSRPCLLYQIKRCCAPCVGKVSQQEYETYLTQIRLYFSGKSRELHQQLVSDMEKAAEELEFEKAALLRDRIKALTIVQAHQDINPEGMPNTDIFALARDAYRACIHVTFIRAEQNFGDKTYYPRVDASDDDETILEQFIAQFYDNRPTPPLILISTTLKSQDLLGQALTSANGYTVQVTTPQRGRRKELIRHSIDNAEQMLARHLSEQEAQLELLQHLRQFLDLDEIPERIEIYDNSHLQGTKALGVMVVAGKDGFEKTQYRKFNMDKVDITPGDDYGMMREMFMRRFSRMIKSGDSHHTKPNLVLIDGGQGQLAVCQEVMIELGLEDIPLVAVAKGPDRNAGREQLFRDGKPPLLLKPNDPVSYFIQRLRDEAHRFAIGGHRTRRKAAITENPLDAITGIGNVRKKALLKHFGSAKAVSRAGLLDLLKVEGISRQVAQKIYDHFHER